MKKSLSRNSESSTQFNSPHSPLRYQSSPLSDQGHPRESESPPPRFHSPENSPENQQKDNNPRAIVVVESSTQYSPDLSPLPDFEHRHPAENEPSVLVMNPARREEPAPSETNLGPATGGGGRREGVDRGRPRARAAGAAPPSPAGSKREEMARKAALGFRLSEVVLCLISFSVMAADKTQGWSGDSFDRYKEYRYCLAVNVIAFVYAGFQSCDLAYQLVAGKPIINHHLRYHFDFFMDQVLAYLLISASSSAATRVDDWQSNWGKDEFTEMASASVGLSFLAFIAFAISSLISGYNLCSLYP